MDTVAVDLAIETVKFVVGGFMQRLEEHKQLIADAMGRMDELEEDNNFLANYLKVAAVRKSKSENLFDTTLLREVRDRVYRAEDAIDSFASQVAERKFKWYSGAIPNSPTANLQIAKLIKSVAESVNKIRQKVEEHDKGMDRCAENEGLPDYEGEPPIQEFCSIFIEEEERLKALLSRKAKQPDVIFITGTDGIGKTSLAAKLFLDSNMSTQFTKHIWVSVPNPTLKDILLVVLRQVREDTAPKTIPYELRKQVQKVLEGEKLLLVLDNVPEMSKADFGSLRRVLGKSDERSKVLITSNNDKLAEFVGHDSHIKLSPLLPDKSWDLLKWRIFSGGTCPSDFELQGKLIAESCNGLPQKIVSAGDDLAEKLRQVKKSNDDEIEVWENFSGDIVSFTLSSYNTLPYHLRPCFLYLGIFFDHSKVAVSKLTEMWIAEGFIPRSESSTLEETAVKYLMELVKRNLVTIDEERLDGSPKTCRIDGWIHKFCKERSAAEGENNRRFCIHTQISNFIEDFISSSHHFSLRSFVSHSKTDEVILHGKNISSIRAAFKLLRVLDAKPIKVNKIYSDLCLLVHLRYVTLSLNGAVLPSSISNLRNVRTLIVHTGPSTTLEIKADILTMVELRHFKTNASATLPKKSKASKHDELHTLCGVSPKSCIQEFFSKIRKLKKLGICGRLALLLDKNEFFSKLDNVEKLKLQNQITGRKSEVDLSRLLDQSLPTPPKLRSLTLSATSLKWEHMSNPGWMRELKELKLKDKSFEGEEWKVSGDGFPNLQTLHIECLDFIRWHASSNQFPRLRRLVLSECKELRGIPFGLADVKSFRELQLHKCNRSAVESAKSIRDEKLTKWKTDKSIVFKLLPDTL